MTSGDLLASASQSAGITGVSHYGRPLDIEFKKDVDNEKRGSLAVYSIRKVKEPWLEKDGLIAKETIIFRSSIKELQCRRNEFVHSGSRA